MSDFDEAMADAVPVMFDLFGEPLEWDGIPIEKAIVEDLEDMPFVADSGVLRLRKKICVRAADIDEAPDPGDEILLLAAWSNGSDGDYWTVESVLSGQGMHDVTLNRFVSR